MKITANQQTFLKRYPQDSASLRPEDKRSVIPGGTVDVTTIQEVDNKHTQIVIPSGQSWYIFNEHWDIEAKPPAPDDILIDPQPSRSVEPELSDDPVVFNPDAILPDYEGEPRRSVCSVKEGFIQKALEEQDYQRLSDEFDLGVPEIKAVMEVEAGGNGFFIQEPAPCRPKILFEAHWFYALTPEPVSRTRPDLASRTWNRALYIGGPAEWNRLMAAIAFDLEPALQSASWGLGQVMGFNFELAGAPSIQQFVVEAFTSEYHQTRHMMNFIKNNNLMGSLRNHDWAGFAYGYNGEGFAVNQYDRKLADAYRRHR